MVDPSYNPPLKRIGYAGGDTFPVTSTTSNDLACNVPRQPVPGDIAEVRAGSDISFHWSAWLYSHKGPITAWMAPYEGSIADVNVNKLEFFKIAEETVSEEGLWANVRIMNFTDTTWTARIPADIKPGNYIIRHEVFEFHYLYFIPYLTFFC
jgi:hypothetical protein